MTCPHHERVFELSDAHYRGHETTIDHDTRRATIEAACPTCHNPAPDTTPGLETPAVLRKPLPRERQEPAA